MGKTDLFVPPGKKATKEESQQEEAEALPTSTTESDEFLIPLPRVPVGGRLLNFSGIWDSFCKDKWALDVVERGYRI